MTDRVSRRVALGTAAGAGAVGALGVLAGPAAASTPAASAAATTLPGPLHTTVAVPSGGVRARRAVGDTVAHQLALFDAAGKRVGDVVVTGTVLAVRGTPGDTAAVHQHLVRLPGGTVAAHGTVDLAGGGEFVVVGGSGAHRGATGSYRVRPGPGTGSTLTTDPEV